MLITVGRVAGFHGVRGEVRVLSDSDFTSERFAAGNEITINGETWIIDSYRTHKNFHLLKFYGIDNLNQVEHLKNSDVMQDMNAVDIELEENEFHYWQIIGLKVKLQENMETIGEVSEIFQTGANDVWVVQGEREHLIPYIAEVVKAVDLESGSVIIDPMEGMLE
ncbi:ribosome maturation factor RimM [Salinicoccus albus]|uniref:ribosome maturation factor RimM n=1 Tax=Salinicoccus albus TaxID=418756 RepID=UPI0003779474|nr:ribosome maturation factor RimM [Salinicoccus albus]